MTPLDYAATIKAVLELAGTCHYEKQHSHQVARLALQIYDQLRSIHQLDEPNRLLLESGALLHDIGWMEGQKGHHKTSMRYILQSALPFAPADLTLVALIARYHRKALPQDDQPEYRPLPPADRRRLAYLSGIVRMTDGLDRTHDNRIQSISCIISPQSVEIICQTTASLQEEFSVAREKSDLLEQALERSVVFKSIII